MKVKIQQVLPRGFYKVKPYSWECELYKEDENGQILVAVDYYCREKDIKDAKIGDFVAVRLDEKSGKKGGMERIYKISKRIGAVALSSFAH